MSSEMFKLEDRLKHHFCLQPTAEEMITELVRNFGTLRSTQFPLLIYQSSPKFRDEMNPRFGLLRGKQFLMNDLYSFDVDEKAAKDTYKIVCQTYERIFRHHLKLENLFIVEANPGAMGGSISHEYQLPNSCAEDKVYLCKKCSTAYKFEVGSEAKTDCIACKSSDSLAVVDTVEVGHTFQLGDKYSSVFNATMSDNKTPYYMCCFGIGVTRTVAASIDVLSTSQNAMRLPESISPFKLAVILPNSDSHPNTLFVNSFIHELDQLPTLRNEILVDDRLDKSIGRKLAEMNQLGVPHILVAPGKKYVDFCEPPRLEYYRAIPKSDQLLSEGLVSHSQIFQIAHML
uniref:proline--tRNA ligase n=1 Tax=Acrobeloides nanus TaxID=290746 RepID=A0A914CCF3_9BILA